MCVCNRYYGVLLIYMQWGYIGDQMFSPETLTPVYFNIQHTSFLGVGNLILIIILFFYYTKGGVK